MNKNQELLNKLEASTNKINDILNYLRKRYAIYGAKLTGGGGGGSIIILADNYIKLIQDLNKKGFDTYLVKIGVVGVRKELYSRFG